MEFGEKLKKERTNRGWSQEELAEKLFVSRQSVSKWENGQNYPSIEVLLKVSDLFEVTVDELLRSDDELKEKVINDSKQLAHPKLKFTFDILFVIGLILFVVKIVGILLTKFTALDITLFGGSFLWNFVPLVLMVVAGIGSEAVKGKYKED
ncbi:helix-turn-helix domain-containing protein [Ornithinibacillus contaminans]|uniref:helix-turn-helix domain-containing protein n=1 Tax=Ornithinibacillus contaminans TaxID=694055 RepID=UPI00064D7B67|nr:helix-turn-helix transcriptional regulator [Ornithinibacillus contaminans]